MAMTFHSTDAGFYTLTATEITMSPALFTQSAQNNAGQLVALNGAEDLQNLESLGRTNLIIRTEFSAPVSNAYLGQTVSVNVDQLTLYRQEQGQEIAIGQLAFDGAITLDATYDNIGANGQSGWVVDIAPSILQIASQQGFAFYGGHGMDAFNLEHQPRYYRETNEIHLRGGDDFAVGSNGNDRIFGGRGDDELIDNAGQNQLFGGAGADQITFGNATDNNFGRGGAGDDILISGHGNDRLHGDAGDDQIFAGNGDDILRGGAGNDTIQGDAGNDRIFGGSGDDLINAGSGDDVLRGGRGQDTFVFFQNTDGQDTIRDFDANGDVIALPDFIGGFEELQLTQQRNGTLITIAGEGFSIKLRGVDADDITADDFIFADFC
ncbi:calcium-binding protein [Paramylibacter kogurei]|nr:calcium-binding protein [Amylibacter kogurei]